MVPLIFYVNIGNILVNLLACDIRFCVSFDVLVNMLVLWEFSKLIFLNNLTTACC